MNPDDKLDLSLLPPLDLSNVKPLGWSWNGHLYAYIYDDEGEIIGHEEVEEMSGEGKGFSWEITVGEEDEDDDG